MSRKTVHLDPFYPVVPDADWVARLVPRGVKTIQLRLKDAGIDARRRQIGDSMNVCARHGCQLIVNDYWADAIGLGADCIHLGQEDLAASDLDIIHASGIGLGVSSHDRGELKTALDAAPHHVALGPIYETTLKKMKWRPQGLDRLADWVARAGRPVVAIGGISLERAADVWAQGPASIAVVTDVVFHDSPDARTDAWLVWAEEMRSVPAA
ncbi:MAG: thiamine phosphate synthase [Hyphomicrobiaceae bacterium]